MLCVYGVTRAAHPGATATGVASEPVRTVAQEPVAAIVSDLADDDLLARRRDVAAYMTVLEEAADAGDILPFRFGTVVADEDELRAVLADGAADYLHLLDK